MTDEYGNSSEKSIGVAVDTTAPVINGVKDETVSAEPTVDSLHYTAEDSRDGEVSVETSIEKTDDSEYTVTAVAKDKAGNEAKETATLTLVEKKTTAKSQSTGKSNSTSQSTSQAESHPAQEAPAETTDDNPYSGMTTDQLMDAVDAGQIEPDHWYCGWCNDGVDYGSAEAFDAHARDVHGVY